MSGRAGSPSFTDLVDLAEGRLPDDRARTVQALADADPAASATLAWIHDFLAQARALPLVQPPAALSARLRAMFAEGGASDGESGGRADGTWPAATGTDGWSRATLTNDSRRPDGVRSGSRDGAHHLAFDSEAGRFVIEVRPAGARRVDLTGVVLGRDLAGSALTFLEQGVVRAVARCQRDGHFEATAVPRSVDEVRLVAEAARVAARLDLLGR